MKFKKYFLYIMLSTLVLIVPTYGSACVLTDDEEVKKISYTPKFAGHDMATDGVRAAISVLTRLSYYVENICDGTLVSDSSQGMGLDLTKAAELQDTLSLSFPALKDMQTLLSHVNFVQCASSYRTKPALSHHDFIKNLSDFIQQFNYVVSAAIADPTHPTIDMNNFTIIQDNVHAAVPHYMFTYMATKLFRPDYIKTLQAQAEKSGVSERPSAPRTQRYLATQCCLFVLLDPWNGIEFRIGTPRQVLSPHNKPADDSYYGYVRFSYVESASLNFTRLGVPVPLPTIHK